MSASSTPAPATQPRRRGGWTGAPALQSRIGGGKKPFVTSSQVALPAAGPFLRWEWEILASCPRSRPGLSPESSRCLHPCSHPQREPRSLPCISASTHPRWLQACLPCQSARPHQGGGHHVPLRPQCPVALSLLSSASSGLFPTCSKQPWLPCSPGPKSGSWVLSLDHSPLFQTDEGEGQGYFG